MSGNDAARPIGIWPGRYDKKNVSIDTIWGVQAGARHVNTFEVIPKHVTLSPSTSTTAAAATTNSSSRDTAPRSSEKKNGPGVMFNVETVPMAFPEHLHKKSKSREELLQSLQRTCFEHYKNKDYDPCENEDVSKIGLSPSQIRLEAVSETANENVVFHGSNGFIMACVTAFAQHLPLTLTPDHIWILISYAFAKHVDLNAEALRKNFVQHDGKKRLEVETPDSFGMSHDGPDTGASASEWEAFVFPQFSDQIKEHIGNTVHSAIASTFTTTTPSAKAAHEITLMSAMKNYFDYGLRTCCGIPNITLLGTEADWLALWCGAFRHLDDSRLFQSVDATVTSCIG